MAFGAVLGQTQSLDDKLGGYRIKDGFLPFVGQRYELGEYDIGIYDKDVGELQFYKENVFLTGTGKFDLNTKQFTHFSDIQQKHNCSTVNGNIGYFIYKYDTRRCVIAQYNLDNNSRIDFDYISTSVTDQPQSMWYIPSENKVLSFFNDQTARLIQLSGSFTNISMSGITAADVTDLNTIMINETFYVVSGGFIFSGKLSGSSLKFGIVADTNLNNCSPVSYTRGKYLDKVLYTFSKENKHLYKFDPVRNATSFEDVFDFSHYALDNNYKVEITKNYYYLINNTENSVMVFDKTTGAIVGNGQSNLETNRYYGNDTMDFFRIRGKEYINEIDKVHQGILEYVGK